MAKSLTLIIGLLLLSNVLYANVMGARGIVPLRTFFLHGATYKNGRQTPYRKTKKTLILHQ